MDGPCICEKKRLNFFSQIQGPSIKDMETQAAQVSSWDKPFIEAVLSLVDESVAAGRHPFAALVVAADGQVLAKAINGSAPPDGIPTQHAELQAAAESHRMCPP